MRFFFLYLLKLYLMLPLVSVICICFNHERFVEKAVNSVLKQTYKNIELIVIDNGSTDNSFSVIQKICQQHPEIHLLHFPETLSITKAFNIGFEYTKGRFLIDLSADDVLLEDSIAKQVAFFLEQSEHVGLIFGNAYHIDKNGQRTAPFFEVNQVNKVIDKSLFEVNYKKLLEGGLTMCSVSSMFTRKHFELLNRYDEDLFFEDLDFWLRLSLNYEIQFLDDFVVEKRFIKDSLGNQFHKNNTFSKKINHSLRQIYKDSLKRNKHVQEHRALLKRIHYSMDQSFTNRLWLDLIKFTWLELLCRYYILFK